jgi:hypothetical protein
MKGEAINLEKETHVAKAELRHLILETSLPEAGIVFVCVCVCARALSHPVVTMVAGIGSSFPI